MRLLPLVVLIAACGPDRAANTLLGEGSPRAQCGDHMPNITQVDSVRRNDTWYLSVTLTDPDGDLHGGQLLFWSDDALPTAHFDGRISVDLPDEWPRDNGPEARHLVEEGSPCELTELTLELEFDGELMRGLGLGKGEMTEFGLMMEDAAGNLSRLQTGPLRAPYYCSPWTGCPDLTAFDDSQHPLSGDSHQLPLYGVHSATMTDDSDLWRIWVPAGWEVHSELLNNTLTKTWEDRRNEESEGQFFGLRIDCTDPYCSSSLYDFQLTYTPLEACEDDRFGRSDWTHPQRLPEDPTGLVKPSMEEEVWSVTVQPHTTLSIGVVQEGAVVQFQDLGKRYLGEFVQPLRGTFYQNTTDEPVDLYAIVHSRRERTIGEACVPYDLRVQVLDETERPAEPAPDLSLEANPYLDFEISEVMANPSAVSDAHGEWLELHNLGPTPVDLSGTYIEDAAGNRSGLAGHHVIEPDGYVVFARDTNPATNGGVQAEFSLGEVSLNNAGDELMVSFDDSFGSSILYVWHGYGESPEGAAIDDVGCPSEVPLPSGDFGTPGAANPVNDCNREYYE